MESKTYIKYLKISPKKLRFIIDDVKKLSPKEALNELFYSQKRAAKMLYKAIKSSINNAKMIFKLDDSMFRFKLLTIEEGPRLKRIMPGGRGTTKSYRRKTAHIKIILTIKN